MRLHRILVMAAVVPFGLAMAGLAIAAAATDGFAAGSAGTQSVALRMPVIGAGTIPVAPGEHTDPASPDHWGVGNG